MKVQLCSSCFKATHAGDICSITIINSVFDFCDRCGHQIRNGDFGYKHSQNLTQLEEIPSPFENQVWKSCLVKF